MPKIPKASIARYHNYYCVVKLLEQSGVEWATSYKLGLGDGVKPMQIRKDLSYLGVVGTRGHGYEIKALRRSLERVLGLDRQWNVCIVGAGDMGAAWAMHTWYQEQGFPVRAIFDTDGSKAGQELVGQTVLPLSELEREVGGRRIDIALITTSPMEAQGAVDAVVASGIRALVSFNEASVEVPDDVYSNTLSMFVDIADISSFVSSEPGFRVPEISVERLARYYTCLAYL